jgi:valyl-tRNA synthetase
MAAWARDEILKLLHPFMPFITEELWGATGKRDALLALSAWPQLSKFEDMFGSDESSVETVINVVSEARSLRTTYNIPPKERLKIDLKNFNPANISVLSSTAASISRLANTEVLIDGSYVTGTSAGPASETKLFVATTPSAGTAISATGSSSFVIENPIKDGLMTVALPGSFDLAAERARLAKEMQKAEADIARVDAKLGNANFVARAPEEVVAEENEKREEAVARKAKLAEAIARLKDTD